MFSSVNALFSNDMAIDLGTANTLVYVPGRGVVLDEPSVVAISHRNGVRKMTEVGRSAKAMQGRAPESIEIVHPMRDGVVADFTATEDMIKHFIRKVHRRKSFLSPQVMLTVPAAATPVERRAVHEAALSSGARRVFLIEEPAAAALGAGLKILEPRGTMVVDIGGGTTDIAIMTLGTIIYARSVRTAGNTFDEAIISHLRHKHSVLVGENTAEALKLESGTAIAKANGTPVEICVKGRDLRRGVPIEVKIEPGDIAEALEQPLFRISDAVQTALEKIPPELAADIYEDGILLTGGGAMLDKIDVKLARQTGVKFTIPEEPMRCVVLGAGSALERLDEVEELLVKAP